MATFPTDRTYHPEHLWAQKQDDGSILVGVSDYAQEQLGSVIFIDLPEVGAHFDQGQSCASIESVKVTSDAIVPMPGTVVAVNEALADTPELLNDSPYGDGWLVRLRPDSDDLSGLLDAASYEAQLS